MGNFLKKLFGSSNDAEIKRLRKTLDKVNALEAEIHALSDEELQAKTPAFKQRLANGETLDALQYITSLVANKDHKGDAYQRVTLDTEGYRARFGAIKPLRYPRWLTSVMIGLSCACFARLIGADWVSCGVALVGIEPDAAQVDLAVQRWQRITGNRAVRESDSRSFAELQAEKEPA